MDKLDKYPDVLTRLVRETVHCSPAEWTSGTLTVDCDGTRINYKLKNESEPGTAVISEKLRTLIDEFYVRMSQAGDVWTQAIVSFSRNGNALDFNTQFQYAKREIATKSRWKFWEK
jgi:hypothetical protein